MTPTALPADILAYIARHFAAPERADTIALLTDTRQADGSPVDVRLLRCALFTSGKTLAGLSFEIDWLKTDSRDVIQGAEFERREGNWVQVRDLSQPFAADA